MTTIGDMAFELAPDDKLLTIKEAAALLSVSIRTITRMVERGDLVAYKVGGKTVRIKKSELFLAVK